MIANSFAIADKRREMPIGLANIKDFVLREEGQVAAESILENPCITLYAMENKTREILKAGTPLLAQHDPDKHLSMVGILTLMWLSVMEQYVKLQEKGVEMLAIRYANWSLAPYETAVAMGNLILQVSWVEMAR